MTGPLVQDSGLAALDRNFADSGIVSVVPGGVDDGLTIGTERRVVFPVVELVGEPGWISVWQGLHVQETRRVKYNRLPIRRSRHIADHFGLELLGMHLYRESDGFVDGAAEVDLEWDLSCFRRIDVGMRMVWLLR